MDALVGIVLPVFLVIGLGYGAVRGGWFSEASVDALMAFSQRFAIPCLLFQAIVALDLGQSFSPGLLGTFFAAALASFGLGILGARAIFGRPWEDSVAIGFICLFSNSLLLGLPITERAYGPEALAGNYAIIALHAPFCYAVGIAVMESVRARGQGRGFLRLGAVVARAILRNALILAILLGFAVNLLGVAVPGPVDDALGLMTRAALPAALFGLGGVLVRYRPEGDLRTVAFALSLSLLLHPALVWLAGHAAGLTVTELRSAVMTAAMPPGINAYLFANMYGVAKRVAATSVLVGTAAAALNAWLWLTLLP